MSMYDRQNLVGFTRVPSSIAIIGTGGVGTWIGIFAAMMGVYNVMLWDPDKVEPSNLSRLPYPGASVGKIKVEMLKAYMTFLRPAIRVSAYPREFDPEKDLDLLENYQVRLAFLSFDNLMERKELETQIRSRGIHCLHVACEVHHLSLDSTARNIMNLETEEERANRQHGYRNPVAQWVGTQATVAALAMLHASSRLPNGRSVSLSLNLEDVLASAPSSATQVETAVEESASTGDQNGT